VIHALVVAARERLIRAGVPPDQAAIDAEVLARHVLGWDRAKYLASRQEPFPPAAAAQFDAAVAQREARVPVAYITGHREFWGREFEVSPAVLIPRPETELILEEALRFLSDAAGNWRIADVGTGSGCLAICLAHERPQAAVVATDLSTEALAVAGRNADRVGVSSRIRFAHTSLLAGFSGPFDLIVANPPYIPRAHEATLPPDVRDHEPEVALFGHGDDGLDDVRALLRQSAERLAPRGRLMMEFGYGQSAAVRAGSEQAGLEVVTILKDLQGHERTLVAALPGPGAAL
jgi:release factor glutamine methyltransferase